MSTGRWKSDISRLAWCKTCRKSWKSGKIHAIARQHSEREGHEVKVVEEITYIYFDEDENENSQTNRPATDTPRGW
ncbi:hypothetical protein LCGC14_2603750 [marine sediment metagenome]|uniref:Uncharacterized protein n=1 Tax=marine sediment metagenome TaxID=412755 RepID=A0A0F9D0M5_9ZZZZ